MATREIATNLTLTGEKEFNTSMAAVNSNMKTLKTEMNAVTSEFGKNDASMTQSIKVSQNLKAQNDQQREVIRAATIALKQNIEAYGADSKQADKFRQIIANAKTQINKNNQELKKYSLAHKAAEAATKATSAAAKGAVSAIKGVGSAAAASAKGIAKLSALSVGAAAAVAEFGVTGLGVMAKYAKEAAEAVKDIPDWKLTEQQKQWKDFGKQLETLDKSTAAAKAALGGVLLPVLGDLSEVGAQFLTDFANDMEAAAGDTEKQGKIMAQYVGKGAQLIKDKLPEYLQTGKALLKGLGEGLSEEGPELLETGIDLVMDLLDQIIEFAPQMGEAGMQLITKLVDSLVERGPDMVTGAAELVVQLVEGLAQAAPTLIPQAVNLVTTLVLALIQMAPDLLLAGLDLVLGIVDGIVSGLGEFISSADQIIDTIKTAFSDKMDQFADVGSQIVHGIWEGISNASEWLYGLISGWVSDIVQWIKNKLDIHSPSGVMEDEVGYWMAEGVGSGFQKRMAAVNKQIAASINTSFRVSNPDTSGGGYSGRYYTVNGSGGNKVVNIYFQAKTITEGEIQMIINRANQEWGEAI